MSERSRHLFYKFQRRKEQKLREHREFFDKYMEFYREQQNFCKNSQRRRPNFDDPEFWKRHHELHHHRKEFMKARREIEHIHKHLRFQPLFILSLNLILWYLLFHFFGFHIMAIIGAALIGTSGFFQMFFLRRLEKRVLNPIDKLKQGVEEIAKGNYDVKVESDVFNDITMLVASFNDMAQKLKENEKIKADYEENRKALLASISHDLKTPITSIQGYIEAISDKKDIDHEEMKRYLEIIYRNSNYMNKLIDDLFLFSKLDMQKLEFQFEEITISNFMDDLMEEIKFELDEKSIGFGYEDRLKSIYMVNIDRKRLYQTFRNVIGNAVKYGQVDGLLIHVALYGGENCVYVEISDNGPGIPEEKLPFIFNRFYRVDAERTKDIMSTGLGLAIARELVEAHGGSISVSSTMGKGSTFTIMLPAKESGVSGVEADTNH